MRGSKVGSYSIGEKLAEGGMGEVYLAQHEMIGRDAVVKVLLPEMSLKKNMVKRFFNEARAAAAIDHPGIVEVFDMGYTDDGRAFIVMERLRGEPLSARLKRSRLSPLQAVSVTRQLAGALQAAHERGIVHRDLKPDNLFLVHDPEVAGGERIKVLDFGIAKLAEQKEGSLMTVSGAVFGTPAYMSPEQCSDTASVDHRADIYAMGCIFYELICGKPPFGFGGLQLLAAHLRDSPPPPRSLDPQIPEPLEVIALHLLQKRPEDRFQSCTELIAAIDALPLLPDSSGTLRPHARPNTPLSVPVIYSQGGRHPPSEAPTLPTPVPGMVSAPQGLVGSASGQHAAAPVAKAQTVTTHTAAAGEATTRAGKNHRSRFVAAGLIAAVALVGMAIGLTQLGNGRTPAPAGQEASLPASQRFDAAAGGGSDESAIKATPLDAEVGPALETGLPAAAESAAATADAHPRSVRIVARKGAEVTDAAGELLGKVPVEIGAPTGDEVVRIVVRARGYQPETVEIDASSAEEIRVDLARSKRSGSAAKKTSATSKKEARRSGEKRPAQEEDLDFLKPIPAKKKTKKNDDFLKPID